MEIETIFGLPAHPFFVHFSVVLIPLASLLALVLALRPKWFDRFGIGVVILSGLGAIGGLIAEGSGEALEESVENTVSHSALESHAEMGELAAKLGMLFFLLVCLAVGLRWWSVRKTSDAAESAAPSGLAGFAAGRKGAAILAALVVLAGAGATYAVSVAGHRGAGLTWNEASTSTGDDTTSEEEGTDRGVDPTGATDDEQNGGEPADNDD